MKKITFLLIAIAYSISAPGQQIALHSGVTIELPAGAKKVTREAALVYARKTYKDTMAQYSLKHITLNKNYFYTLNNILIELTGADTTYNLEKEKLIKLKASFDEMARWNKSDTATIIKGNHNAAVVTKNIIGNTAFIRFFCINDANTRELNGVIKFNKEDEAEAKKILNDLLAGIKFKD